MSLMDKFHPKKTYISTFTLHQIKHWHFLRFRLKNSLLVSRESQWGKKHSKQWTRECELLLSFNISWRRSSIAFICSDVLKTAVGIVRRYTICWKLLGKSSYNSPFKLCLLICVKKSLLPSVKLMENLVSTHILHNIWKQILKTEELCTAAGITALSDQKLLPVSFSISS